MTESVECGSSVLLEINLPPFTLPDSSIKSAFGKLQHRFKCHPAINTRNETVIRVEITSEDSEHVKIFGIYIKFKSYCAEDVTCNNVPYQAIQSCR